MFKDEKSDGTDSLLTASLFPAAKKSSEHVRPSSLLTSNMDSESDDDDSELNDDRNRMNEHSMMEHQSEEEEEEIDEETGLTKSQKILGMICVTLMVFIWLVMSLIGGEIKCPIFARYLVCSLYSVLFPLWVMIAWMKRRRCLAIISEDQNEKGYYHNNGDNHSKDKGYYSKVINEADYLDTAEMIAESKNLSSKVMITDDGTSISASSLNPKRKRTKSNAATDALRHSFLTAEEASMIIEHLSWSGMSTFIKSILPLGLLATWMAVLLGWFWYTSLEHTDFTVNNVIYQSSCAFVYILACFVTKTATLTIRKTLSVVVCLTGVVLISFNSGGNDGGTKTTMMGIVWCVLGVICYAVFIIVVEWIESNLYRCHLSTEDSIFLTALIGPLTLLTFWPVLMIVQSTHMIDVKIPLPWHSDQSSEFWQLVGMAMLDLFYYLFLLLGVSYSNAVLMSTGTLMLIPVSFVLDSLILRKYEPNLMAVLGALLICVGFLCMQVSPKLLFSKCVCGCCSNPSSSAAPSSLLRNEVENKAVLPRARITPQSLDSPRSPALL